MLLYRRAEQLLNRVTGEWYTARVYVRAVDLRHAVDQFKLGHFEWVEVFDEGGAKDSTYPTPVEELSALEQLAYIEPDNDDLK